MTDPSCKSCRFWQQYDESGNCRRYPPTIPSKASHRPTFPWTGAGDWCGEFQVAGVDLLAGIAELRTALETIARNTARAAGTLDDWDAVTEAKERG